ncbi:hypothetical protein C5S53_10485, partial [Methanophagales archaeon]
MVERTLSPLAGIVLTIQLLYFHEQCKKSIPFEILADKWPTGQNNKKNKKKLGFFFCLFGTYSLFRQLMGSLASPLVHTESN